jgi:dienelactone hydrolase
MAVSGHALAQETPPQPPPFEVPFTLTKPAGAGPFPAVVILHDCSGLGPRSSGAPARWSAELVQQGYVTIRPDSFTSRGHPDGVCLGGSYFGIFRDRAMDAYGALRYLRRQPFVDRDRIGVMGGSHGGAATLATIVALPMRRQMQRGFAAALALYPACGLRYGDWDVTRDGSTITEYKGVFEPLAPLLILTGELDDWTPAEPCRQLVERSKAAGFPANIKIYPGAHHSFDSNAPVRFVAERMNMNREDKRGATTGGNQQAWDDAKVQVRDFFAKHLKLVAQEPAAETVRQ